MTQSKVLVFLVAESGIWLCPNEFAWFETISINLSLLFVLVIACLEQLSQVLTRATVSTFVLSGCITTENNSAVRGFDTI